MKSKLLTGFIISLFILFSMSLNAESTKKWTIMVYCCADNNLDMAGVNDLNELELSGSDENINIIYLLDRWGVDDTHLYYVTHDSSGLPAGDDNNIISPIIDNQAGWLASEEDMGNPETLQDFLVWSIQNYPAEHYLLSIWDHGSGIFKSGDGFIMKGECWDDNGGNPDDYIDLAEFKQVMASGRAAAGKKIDIVGHDVCLGGQFETHYQARYSADISIASPDNEPFDGWDYEGPFVNLKSNPDMTPRELAGQIVQFYYEWYGQDVGCCNTQAAVDLNVMVDHFMPAFDSFNSVLSNHFNEHDSIIKIERRNSPSYSTPNYELYNFAQALAINQSLPSEVRSVALNLVDAIDSSFINSKTANYTEGYGCTIWFPKNYSAHSDIDQYETQVDLSRTSWRNFLKVFAGEMVIVTDSAISGKVRRDYSQSFCATNGELPLTWERIAGQLPYGLSLQFGDTLTLSGQPTYATSYTFSLKVTDSSNPPRIDTRTYTVIIGEPDPYPGDCDGSGVINTTDPVYLINFIFNDGPSPYPLANGDSDCDGKVNLVDVIYLINYIFRGGNPPCVLN